MVDVFLDQFGSTDCRERRTGQQEAAETAFFGGHVGCSSFCQSRIFGPDDFELARNCLFLFVDHEADNQLIGFLNYVLDLLHVDLVRFSLKLRLNTIFVLEQLYLILVGVPDGGDRLVA